MSNRAETFRESIMARGNPGGLPMDNKAIKFTIEGEERISSYFTRKKDRSLRRSLRRKEGVQNTEEALWQLGLAQSEEQTSLYGLWRPLEESPRPREELNPIPAVVPSKFAKVRGMVSAFARRLGFL